MTKPDADDSNDDRIPVQCRDGAAPVQVQVLLIIRVVDDENILDNAATANPNLSKKLTIS